MNPLIDTDILIDIGRGDPIAYNYLLKLETQHIWLAVSVVTQMELIVGCRNKAELRALDNFLARFRIIEINESISNEAVELLKQYRLSPMDCSSLMRLLPLPPLCGTVLLRPRINAIIASSRAPICYPIHSTGELA
ncbi:MAG: PIN domain-containing protein [Roseiflexus sp.]|nr:PIN domain-containing protein [Roseiflexus sp.]MCS7289057.1 PIN domain-containing protein [Roseiflexus sp.]MDW8232701.1 PIN domain-containing protein [Roseiflexaceae bacterium]